MLELKNTLQSVNMDTARKTVIENLQTLCARCNLGKSDLLLNNMN